MCFSLRLCPSSFWIPSIAGVPGGQGFLGRATNNFSFDELFGKNWGYKISATRLYGKTATSGFDCHDSILSLGKTRERSEDRF